MRYQLLSDERYVLLLLTVFFTATNAMNSDGERGVDRHLKQSGLNSGGDPKVSPTGLLA